MMKHNTTKEMHEIIDAIVQGKKSQIKRGVDYKSENQLLPYVWAKTGG